MCLFLNIFTEGKPRCIFKPNKCSISSVGICKFDHWLYGYVITFSCFWVGQNSILFFIYSNLYRLFLFSNCKENINIVVGSFSVHMMKIIVQIIFIISSLFGFKTLSSELTSYLPLPLSHFVNFFKIY